MKEKISEMSSRELYGIIPFRVHEHFINSFVSEWKAICLGCFDDVETALNAVVESLCRKHFERFETSGLLYEVRCIPFDNIKLNS